MQKYYTRFFIFFLLYTSNVWSQDPHTASFPLVINNKSVSINALVKLKNGYITTATNQGVYKFDGKQYHLVPADKEFIKDSATAIYQDPQDVVWVGYQSGKIARLIGNMIVGLKPEEGYPQKKITSFVQDSYQQLWISTNGEGMYILNKNRLYAFDEDDGLSDNHVLQLLASKKGIIVASTDQGVNFCSFKSFTKKTIAIGPKQGLPDYMVTALAHTRDENIWVGLQDNGFCSMVAENQKITIPEIDGGWKYGQINCLYPKENILWIGTRDHGLFQYNTETKTLKPTATNITDQNIITITSDHQGNIWFVTASFGLTRCNEGILQRYNFDEMPRFEDIHALLSDKDGFLWMNTYENNLLRIDSKLNNAEASVISLEGLNEFTDITSLYQDIQGRLWIGTMGKGLYIMDPDDYTYRTFSEDSSLIEGNILSVNGKGNSVFVSSLQGCFEITLPDSRVDISEPLSYIKFPSRETGSSYVYALFKDSKERIWFATDGNGLFMKNGNNYRQFDKRTSIKDDHIFSIAEDKKGSIWFSTGNAGIYKYDGKHFYQFSSPEGLSNLNISAVTTEPTGNIVILHKSGLDILNPLTGKISYINSAQGISQINAEDLGAVTHDRYGRVVTSTPEGILTYEHPVNSKSYPEILIESVQLFLNDIDTAKQVKFSHDENNFTFNYTGLYYSDPDGIYYQYKLEGLDTAWITTKDKSKIFPKLNPGTYRFKIRASLNQNFSNAVETSYSFEIRKAFYKNYFFIAGMLLLGALLIYLLIKNKERSVKNLERLRREKIQFQFEILRNQVNPHFLFNSFNTLISEIEDDPKTAVTYTEHLASFFRSILKYRELDVIPLREDLELLRNYFYLQQKRYGDGISLDIKINESQQQNWRIPPLTLQLLLENAIKHNSISKEKRLIFRVYCTDRYLAVSNNINERRTRQEGAGIGLQNIINRFTLLTDNPVTITQKDGFFIVSLPLIDATHDTNPDH